MNKTISLSDIQVALGEDWSVMKSYIQNSLASDIDLLNKINGHLFLTSGKMLRPLLSLLVSKACGANSPLISKVCAAASEIIHTATLLHDDVVDESLYRRGKLTVNALFSPGASLLMGDFWLARAIRIIIENKCDYRVISYFSQTIEDLAEGEMLQMQRADDCNTTMEDYLSIIHKKTASLFIASMCTSAVAEQVNPEVEEGIKEFAHRLGLAFQMRDDILDYTPTKTDGKDVGSDLAERKVTLPLLCALKNNPDKELEVRAKLREIDPSKGADKQKNDLLISEIKRFVLENNGIQDAKAYLNKHIGSSIECLNVLPDSLYRDYMVSIVKILSM